MLVILVAIAKLLALKAGTISDLPIGLVSLQPCWPTCLVCLSAFFVPATSA